MTAASRLDLAALAGGLHVPPQFRAQVTRINRTLRVDNPAWIRWSRSTNNYGDEPPRYLSPIVEIPEGPWAGGWTIPRHACVDVGRLVDRRVCPPAPRVELVEDLVLRPFQAEALEALKAEGEGVVVAGCGAGKTTLGIAAVAHFPTRALVLVHSLDLATQWRERAEAQLQGAEVGQVGGGRDDRDARVVVATVQTLVRWGFSERLAWGQGFGLVIVDEAHHTPASTFLDLLGTLPAQHRLGLTATPTRDDGLTPWLYATLGPQLYQVRESQLQAAGIVMRPEIRWVGTGWSPAPCDQGRNQAHLRDEAMATSDRRNGLLLTQIREQLADGRQVLVLVKRVAHAELLASILDAEVNARALVGSMKKRERHIVLEAARAGHVDVLIGTSLADEGLDLPGLDCVVLAVPSGSTGKIKQRIGRVVRCQQGKRTPVVIDLVDAWGPYQGYARRRQQLYRSLGWAPPELPGRDWS